MRSSESLRAQAYCAQILRPQVDLPGECFYAPNEAVIPIFTNESLLRRRLLRRLSVRTDASCSGVVTNRSPHQVLNADRMKWPYILSGKPYLLAIQNV
jgi:hypothetical protein